MSKEVKELYIRLGNSKETSRFLMIGEESSLGSRDLSGYTPHKGAVFTPLRKDPYTGREGLTYIHITPNIKLDTKRYQSDHDVHNFIKKNIICRSFLLWDGEKDEGIVRSREVFILDDDGTPAEVYARRLYNILEKEIHGKGRIVKNIIVNILKVIGIIILFPIKIILTILVSIFFSKRKCRKIVKKIWYKKH